MAITFDLGHDLERLGVRIYQIIFHLWIMYISTVLLAKYVLEIRSQCKLNKVMAVHRFTVTIWEISSSGMMNIPSSGFLTKYICRIALLRLLCTFGNAIMALYTSFVFCKILFFLWKIPLKILVILLVSYNHWVHSRIYSSVGDRELWVILKCCV